MKKIYQEIFEQAKPLLRTRNSLVHTRIVLRYALKLLKEEEGDEEVVIPAILLHDVGWKVIPKELQLTAFGPNPSDPEFGKVREVEGAKIAGEILVEAHYPLLNANEISRIIQGHDPRFFFAQTFCMRYNTIHSRRCDIRYMPCRKL